MMRVLLILPLLIATSIHGQVRFVPNEGQWPDHVHHRATVTGGGVQVEATGWTCWQWAPPALVDDVTPNGDQHHAGARKGVMWRATWVDAQGAHQDWSRQGLSQDRMNFYVSEQPEQWAEGLQAAEALSCNGPWPGMQLRWRGTRSGNAKFTVDVAPGADPNPIAWRYEGVHPRLCEDGTLALEHPLHQPEAGFSAHLDKPLVWQHGTGGQLEFVPCSYEVHGNTVRLVLGAYDATRKLIIDPEIVFSTFVGSTGDNFGTTASNGPDDALVGGTVVFGPGYPTTPGAIQTNFSTFADGVSHIGLTVFNGDGSDLLYSTYLGGSHGDIPHSLAYNAQWGRIVLFGSTGSADFPSTAGAYQTSLTPGPPSDITIYGVESQPQGVDCFVASFSGVDFTLESSTFLGGSGIDGINSASALRANFGDYYRGQIDIGPNGSVWIATTTSSTDLGMPGSPAHAGGFDALIAGFDSDLSTLLCGRTFGGSGDDAAYSLEVAPDASFGAFGNLDIIVGGGTASFNLPLPPGGIQPSLLGGTEGWIARFTAGPDMLTPQFGTYHGLADYDQVFFVQRDSDGRPYAYGQARTGMPVIGNVYANPGSGQYITCFINDLSDIAWQTSIGTGSGTIDISPTAFLVSECDQLYISGWGGTTNGTGGTSAVQGSTTFGLPTTADAYQSSTDGSDFYLAVFAPDAEELVYATFLGGQFANEHVDGGSSRFDTDGTVYQSACAGCGGWDDFPSTPNAWSPTNPSPNCNMGVFKFALGSMNAAIDIVGPDAFCIGQNVQFVNNTTSQALFTWDFGDATFSDLTDPDHLYGIPGVYEVQLIAEDPIGCLEPDTAFITITVEPDADPQIDPVDPLCLGDGVQLQGSGFGTLSWAASNSLSATNIPDPVASPSTTTTYTLTDQTNCSTASVDITVDVIDMGTTASNNTQICLGNDTPLEISSTNSAAGSWDYSWVPPDGLSDPNSASPTASPDQTTTYTATVTTPENCIRVHDITVAVIPAAPPDSVYPNVPLCTGQSTVLESANGSFWTWSPAAGLNNTTVQYPLAFPATTTTYTVEVTNLCGSGIQEVTVEVIVPTADVGPGGWTCPGEAFPISASGGVQYLWVPSGLVTNPGAAETTAVTAFSQVFTAYVTDADGCVATEEVTINVWPTPQINAGPDQQNDWLEPTFLYGSVIGAPVDSLWWDPAGPLSCGDCLIPEVLLQEDATFTLHVVDTNGCRSADVTQVTFAYPLYTPTGFTPDGDGLNDGWRPEGNWLNGAGTYTQGNPDPTILPGYRLEIWNRWGELIWATEDPRAYWTGGVGGPGMASGAAARGGGTYFAPIGTYHWKVFFPTRKGIETRQGVVNLIR